MIVTHLVPQIRHVVLPSLTPFSLGVRLLSEYFDLAFKLRHAASGSLLGIRCSIKLPLHLHPQLIQLRCLLLLVRNPFARHVRTYLAEYAGCLRLG